ncbi:uncharacterized protein [Acropora muricata]|uniref:uncharacterized protein n=1 Tax=Acropora muricata TaxID=159855 RepID=UPI0034E5D208
MSSFGKSLTLFIALLVKGCLSDKHNDCARVEKWENISIDKRVDTGECKPARKSSTEANATSINCIPLDLTEERYLVFFGYHLEKILTIQSCQRESNTCRRHSRFISYYPGTEYKKAVDVGVCGGLSENGKTCKPIAKGWKAIATPVGDRCIPIIVNCSLIYRYCYRETNLEGFSELYADSTGANATRIKVVDMGKCVSETNFCPFGEHEDGSNSQLISGCMPETFTSHYFISSTGHPVNISAIATCSCQPYN